MTTQANWPNFLAVDFYCGAGGTTRGLDYNQYADAVGDD